MEGTVDELPIKHVAVGTPIVYHRDQAVQTVEELPVKLVSFVRVTPRQPRKLEQTTQTFKM